MPRLPFVVHHTLYLTSHLALKVTSLQLASNPSYTPDKLLRCLFQKHSFCVSSTGCTTMQTPFGHTVPVYDMERTICDLLRSRSRIEEQSFQSALKQYAVRTDKNLRTLMRDAKLFHVEKKLRQYLEVLL